MSSHSWGNDVIYQRIYGLDGTVAPRTAEARGFADGWVQHKAWATQQGDAPKGYDFGIGYGADTNGLGGQPGPRTDARHVAGVHPQGFAAPIGGVRLAQQKSGLRTFDVTKEGVGQYGMFADWFQEVAPGGRRDVAGAWRRATRSSRHAQRRRRTTCRCGSGPVFGARSCVADRVALQVEDLHAALGRQRRGLPGRGRASLPTAATTRTSTARRGGQRGASTSCSTRAGTARALRPSASGLVPAAGHDPGTPRARHLHLLGRRGGRRRPARRRAACACSARWSWSSGLTGLGAGTLTGRNRRSGRCSAGRRNSVRSGPRRRSPVPALALAGPAPVSAVARPAPEARRRRLASCARPRQRRARAVAWRRTAPSRIIWPVPEDRYAVALGCYTVEAPGQGFVRLRAPDWP